MRETEVVCFGATTFGAGVIVRFGNTLGATLKSLNSVALTQAQGLPPQPQLGPQTQGSELSSRSNVISMSISYTKADSATLNEPSTAPCAVPVPSQRYLCVPAVVERKSY